MATTARAGGLADARDVLGDDNVLVLGEDEVDLAALRSVLVERGWTVILSEGGPSLFADLLAAGVVDELCWTVVPRLTGGDAVRIATGADVDVPLRPALLLEQDGTLLGRWLVS